MRPEISVVLPVHNEENNIGVLLREIASVFENVVKKAYEIIVVDDDSDDGSVSVVKETIGSLGPSNLLVKINLLPQPVRHGQSAALFRGMAAAEAELIITMDADLQHDPADIPRLLAMMADYDMVCGIRKNRSDGAVRHLCSKIANTFRNWITTDSVSDSGCMFRVIRKKCLPVILQLEGRMFGCEFFFYAVFVRRKGFKVGEAEVRHRQRTAGKSNYRLMRGRFVRGIEACIRVRRLIKLGA